MTEHILDKIARELFTPDVDITDTESGVYNDIDLTRPPGFAGEICDYINSQCRYSRRHLAAISAIVTVANMGSMKYRSTHSQTGANLFAFCVAGSTTGKEAVLQAVSDLHIEAGISSAMHGKIKSDRELVWNLLRHQASFYAMDEIGIELKKIVNSHKSGGATYLQSVIGTLMSIYSKSNGNYLLSGDMKLEACDMLKKEYARESASDDPDEDKLQSLLDQVNKIDKRGIERPFLSLIGFTTPSTFNDIVSLEQITSGFIGRSLIVNEPDTNPRRKRGFVKAEMSEQLREKIAYFCANGSSQQHRVEMHQNQIDVNTTPEAANELENVADWFEDEADKHTERTGFEAVVRRGYELVDKISFILAMESRERTVDHVEWAHAYVMRDMEYKTLLAHSNVKEKSDPVQSMAAKIMAVVGDGITVGRLVNRYRANKDVVEQAITFLENNKKINIEYVKTKFQKAETKFITKNNYL